MCNNQALTLERAVICCWASCLPASDQQEKIRAETDAMFGWVLESFLRYLGTLSACLGCSAHDHHISVCNHMVNSVSSVSEEIVSDTTFANAKEKMLSGGK